MNDETIKPFVDWTKRKIRLHLSADQPVYFYERELWWASVGHNIGFEQNGKHDHFERPVLILRKFNKHVFLGIPLTSQKGHERCHALLTHNNYISYAILSQVRLFSSKRLRRKIRMLGIDEMTHIQDKLFLILKDNTHDQ